MCFIKTLYLYNIILTKDVKNILAAIVLKFTFKVGFPVNFNGFNLLSSARKETGREVFDVTKVEEAKNSYIQRALSFLTTYYCFYEDELQCVLVLKQSL